MDPQRERAKTVDAQGRVLRDLRVSVIDACNLRCTYCMPAEDYPDHYDFLRPGERMSFDEIERLVRIFADCGACKIRLTGGEPLLRRDLPDLVARLKPLPGVEELALTTNGLHLARHAAALKQAGLDRVTVSLDSLDEEIFGRMNGRGASVKPVLEGIDRAAEVGLTPVKLNVVVQRNVNEGSVLDIVERFRGTGHIVRFIEYMDVGNRNGWDWSHVVPSRELVERIHARYPLRLMDPNYGGEVARRYAFEDGAGEIGFVTSVTEPFCGDCTRARLSADGRLFTCLFATSGTDLLGPLRRGASDDEIRAIIETVWGGRTDRYSELRHALRAGPASAAKVEMYQIGG